MKIFIIRMVAVLGATFLLAACTQSSIHLVKTWKSPETTHRKYGKILVVGASDKLERRQIFEDFFTEKFKQQGIAAVQSYLVVHTGDTLSREHLKEAARISGSDSVLITRLVEIMKEIKVMPGSEVLTFKPVTAYPVISKEDDRPPKPGAYYGDHVIPDPVTYYGGAVIREPPTITTNLEVSMETRLFDATTSTMVWDGVTTSGAVNDLKKATETFATEIIKALVKDGMI